MADRTSPAFEAIAATRTAHQGRQSGDLTPVTAFLARFGYLSASTRAGGPPEEETSQALTRYQRHNGLDETGEFDDATRTRMTTHRCGLPDMAQGIAFSTRCAWANPNLTYAFDTGTSDTPGDAERTAVRSAFNTWAAASPLTFAEVGISQDPDIVVGWRPANDPDLSMVGGILAHADFPPGCGVVTNGLPKPVHFDDEEHDWTIGANASAFDIETVALHEIGHIIGLHHSNVAGSVMFASVSANRTKRGLTADDLGGLAELYPPNIPEAGTYTMQHRVNGRFLDAHESSANDFSVVTRTRQANDTQRWVITPIGGVYTIRQRSNGRFMDAHENSNDFSAVTRPAQDNASQRWVLITDAKDPCVHTMQQLVNGRYADAHDSAANDFSVVTRTRQANDTQRWVLTPDGPHTFTIQQRSSGRFLDAHDSAANDFSVVTRTRQANDTQRWVLGLVGVVCTVQQTSSGRFLDAHESSGYDFSAVTRPAQHNDSQRWVMVASGGGTFTVQQLLRGRYLDAHESSANDFSAVTRPVQHNDSQRWTIERA